MARIRCQYEKALFFHPAACSSFRSGRCFLPGHEGLVNRKEIWKLPTNAPCHESGGKGKGKTGLLLMRRVKSFCYPHLAVEGFPHIPKSFCSSACRQLNPI